MNGFVYDSITNGRNESNPESMFDQTNAPIINTLAKEFAVFDKWFASAPTGTDPNRAFAMSGTSDGILTNFNGSLYTQQSYFDYLREHNHTFAGYYQDDLWALGYFKDLLDRKNSIYVKHIDYFFKDVLAGDLPEFTWLQPILGIYGTSEHPQVPTYLATSRCICDGRRKANKKNIRSDKKWA